MAANTDPCAICLGEISRGQAVFVAECSHTFHHRCISESVAHGNRDCPLCKATWLVVPSVDPAAVPAPAMPPPRAYADDDPVAQQTAVQAQSAEHVVAGEMSLKTHCEFPAVARDASRDNFAVLVHARAPGLAAADAEASRAPVDLVTVLDVSGSMTGPKLALVKQAMRFVIDNLGPDDRLSVVSFSCRAKREMRLARMSDDGKASAKLAVESLIAGGSTNIGDGLKVASESGRYESTIDADGRAATVDVGELYAEEERRFLFFVDVPRAEADGEDATQLVKVRCTYRDVATGSSADVAGEDAVVQRPAEVTNPVVSVEVERERIRVAAAEEIVAAREAAERGAFGEARSILGRRL
ncbi:hypothetical protein HU200_049405 [Digitaria exilis]|uniref:Zinc finger protein n=1 Tax=Digitaria exilis TaxID=1010633 RepID=A0A835AU16_9POAL|nr:hypothetical protein HU200_049405 [Digitaria exilis]